MESGPYQETGVVWEGEGRQEGGDFGVPNYGDSISVVPRESLHKTSRWEQVTPWGFVQFLEKEKVDSGTEVLHDEGLAPLFV